MRTKLSPPPSGSKKTKAEQPKENDKRLRTQLEGSPGAVIPTPERDTRGREIEREKHRKTKRHTRKESEANECGGRLEQKEIRRPTRYLKHRRKGEEERRNKQRERSKGGGGQAGERTAESEPLRTAEEYRREGGREQNRR